ncbi:MAG: DUF533 domain-containing protein [Thiolinea sp.]
MSLMGTLGKVAVGVMLAKGVGKLVSNSGSTGSSSGGLGGLLGNLTGGSSGSSSGGLGDLLGSLTGGAAAGGGLGSLLGGLTGQGAAAGSTGGLGGLLNQLGAGSQQSNTGGSSFGDLFNTVLQGNEPEQVTVEDEQHAALMLRAMIYAAKADGQLDADEQKKITQHLGDDVTAEEADMVRQLLQSPPDLQGLIDSVPAGMEQQVYLMSLLGITLDTQEEARYLDRLAQGLNLSHEACNQIHDQLGAQRLYS